MKISWYITVDSRESGSESDTGADIGDFLKIPSCQSKVKNTVLEKTQFGKRHQLSDPSLIKTRRKMKWKLGINEKDKSKKRGDSKAD